MRRISMPEGSRERSSFLLRSHGIRCRLADNRSIGDGRRRDPCQGNQLNQEIEPHPQDRAAAFYPQVAIKLPRFALRDPGGQYQLGGWLKTWQDLESGSLVDTPIFLGTCHRAANWNWGPPGSGRWSGIRESGETSVLRRAVRGGALQETAHGESRFGCRAMDRIRC